MILKNKDIKIESPRYELTKIDTGMKEILEKYSNTKQPILLNASIRGQIQKITVMLQKFCFDQITQMKNIYCKDINFLRKDFR